MDQTIAKNETLMFSVRKTKSAHFILRSACHGCRTGIYFNELKHGLKKL
jgi:hypothetical protein